VQTFWNRLKATLSKSGLERELDDELRFHLEMIAEENVQRGMPLDEARRAARRSFGGVEQVKESYRDRRGFPALDSLIQDIRFGLRMLRRNPGFTIVAVVTLAFGIGANTGVFSVVNAVILRPLHFPAPDRLMVVLSTVLGTREAFQSAQGVFVDWRERSTSFEVLAGERSTEMIWSGIGQPRSVSVAATSFNFFSLVGVQPILGRTFTKDEDQPGRGDVALVDAGFWRRELGGEADLLGRKIILDDKLYSIIGVLPPGVRFGYFATDIWIPMAADRRFRAGGDVVAVGRLRPGVTRETAQAEMDAIMRAIGHEHVQDSKTGVLVEPLHDWVVGDVRRTFLLLMGAVAFVLLICCANIANLLMAHSTSRQQEMAIRAILGAGRWRLARQSLVESILLASIAGSVGFWLAVAVVRAVPRIRSFYIPRVEEITIDYGVLVIAAVITLGSGILFGLAPAFQTGFGDLGVALRRGNTSVRGHASGARLRNALVVAQLAIALVLLSGAGLMTNSLLRLLNIDLGFERSHVLTIGTRLPYRRYDQKRTVEFQRRLIVEVGRLPGVQGVSASDYLPLQAVLFPMRVRTELGGTDWKCEALARHVAPNYLHVMGIPVFAGRDLKPADDIRKPIPVLINKKAAHLLFDANSPIEKHLITNYAERKVLEVIGVVGDARQIGLKEEPGPQLYLPLVYGPFQYVVARVAPNAGDLASAIRSVVRTLDPEVPAPEISTMDAVFSHEVAKPRFYMMLLGAFAATGLILAAVGTYGVMSYTVARRRHEFGVRMALGAAPGDILRLVLGAGTLLTCTGLILGLAGALAATRLLSTSLYGVRPGDPLTLGCVLVLLAGIALLACYIAARRATTADPNMALKCD
jgi:predicted permease